MNKFLAIFVFTFAIAVGDVKSDPVTNERISEITQRLENYSANQLLERRDFLVSFQDDGTEEDANGVPAGSAAERAVEISIIEALLVALGVVIADNVSEDSTTPPDTVFPIITVLGDNPATVELGSTYTDAGATSDGGETVTSSGSVDTNSVGTYTITYSASDAAGNTSTATRTVNVVDTTAPIVVVNGDNPATVELGSTYTDAGATVTDLDTFTLTSETDVNTSIVASGYFVRYTATDASGNVGTATRTVNVVDTTAPVITSSDTFVADENQTAIGTVTATDLQSVTFSVSGAELQITSDGVLTFVTAPDYETKSVYTATVTATDESSNSSTQDITVNVNDVDEGGDDTGTGTGTGTSTGTGTGTGTS